jgi:threonine dehydrogenase-like Zn-dependent dehydrogenase
MMLLFAVIFLVCILCIFAATTTSLSTTPTASVKSKSAVIIGGGPVGLAASLMLEKCGFNDITIIEKRSSRLGIMVNSHCGDKSVVTVTG